MLTDGKKTPMSDNPPPDKPNAPQNTVSDMLSRGDKQPDGRTRVMLHIPAVKPYVTYAILAAYALLIFPMLVRAEAGDAIFNMGALERYRVLSVGEYHRLITALFLHVNLVHLALNALTLYLFGANMERIFGHTRFALTYLLGGLAGSVIGVLLTGAEVFAVATSGAALAVLATEYVYLYRHRKLLGKRGWRRRWWVLLFIALLLTAGLGSSLHPPLVAENWAHLGGLVGGFILAWIITPVFNLRRHPVYPDALTTEDINPLARRVPALSIYSAALLATLLIGVLLTR